jgi:hypothetical protein
MRNDKTPVFNDDEDDLVRCRRVRDKFNARFKTLDELFAWLQTLEPKAAVNRRGRAATRKAAATGVRAARVSKRSLTVAARQAHNAHTHDR